jgi:hypothetical protein
MGGNGLTIIPSGETYENKRYTFFNFRRSRHHLLLVWVVPHRRRRLRAFGGYFGFWGLRARTALDPLVCFLHRGFRVGCHIPHPFPFTHINVRSLFGSPYLARSKPWLSYEAPWFEKAVVSKTKRQQFDALSFSLTRLSIMKIRMNAGAKKAKSA